MEPILKQEYKVVEIREGIYIKEYNMRAFDWYEFSLTDDISKACRWDGYDDGINDVVEHSFGIIRNLKINYTIEKLDVF